MYSCAERPGIKKGEIPEKKDLPACCLYLEVIYFRPGRIEISFVPAVDNLCHFAAFSLIGKGHWTFVSLVAAVAFYVYAFIWLGLDIP